MKLLVNSEQAITNIANAIRSKTGSTAQMTVKDMPTAIANISSGGTVAVDTTFKYISGFYDTSASTITASSYDRIIEYLASGLKVTLNYINGTGDSSYDDYFDNALNIYAVDIIPDYHIQSGYSYTEMAGIIVLVHFRYSTRDGLSYMILQRESE